VRHHVTQAVTADVRHHAMPQPSQALPADCPQTNMMLIYVAIAPAATASNTLLLSPCCRFKAGLQPGRLSYVHHLAAQAPLSKLAQPDQGSRLPPNVQPSVLQVSLQEVTAGLGWQQQRAEVPFSQAACYLPAFSTAGSLCAVTEQRSNNYS
jgi:hypothetical protein